MNPRAFKRMVLATVMVGGVAAVALPQIPLPPLPPGLDIRITSGRQPAPRREVRSRRPGPDSVWVNGFWHSDSGRWNWVPGRWERQPVAQAYWIPARYVRSGRGTIYEPGHWSNQQLVVNDDLRKNRDWQRHERQHQLELERERNRENYRDRYQDRDHR